MSMEWRDIKSCPTDGTWVLLAGESGYVMRPYFACAGRWNDYKQRWEGTEDNPLLDYGISATHWIPLPPAPSARAAPSPGETLAEHIAEFGK